MGTTEPREAILTAALELFPRFGFKKTSVEEIATRARIGKGTIYLHFPSKEELFGAVVRRVWGKSLQELTIEVKNAATPEEKLAAYVKGRVNQFVKRASELQVPADMFFELRAAADPYLDAFEEAELQLLEGILIEGRDSRAFVIDEPGSLALALRTALRAVEVEVIDPKKGEPLRAAMDSLCLVLIRGLKIPNRIPANEA